MEKEIIKIKLNPSFFTNFFKIEVKQDFIGKIKPKYLKGLSIGSGVGYHNLREKFGKVVFWDQSTPKGWIMIPSCHTNKGYNDNLVITEVTDTYIRVKPIESIPCEKPQLGKIQDFLIGKFSYSDIEELRKKITCPQEIKVLDWAELQIKEAELLKDRFIAELDKRKGEIHVLQCNQDFLLPYSYHEPPDREDVVPRERHITGEVKGVELVSGMVLVDLWPTGMYKILTVEKLNEKKSGKYLWYVDWTRVISFDPDHCSRFREEELEKFNFKTVFALNGKYVFIHELPHSGSDSYEKNSWNIWANFIDKDRFLEIQNNQVST